jgi:hypothetical protein
MTCVPLACAESAEAYALECGKCTSSLPLSNAQLPALVGPLSKR